MVYKSLNNWVARSFINELVSKNYASCVYLYMNCYQLLKKSCWHRLLFYFFETDLKTYNLRFDEPLLNVNYKSMLNDYEELKGGVLK